MGADEIARTGGRGGAGTDNAARNGAEAGLT